MDRPLRMLCNILYPKLIIKPSIEIDFSNLENPIHFLGTTIRNPVHKNFKKYCKEKESIKSPSSIENQGNQKASNAASRFASLTIKKRTCTTKEEDWADR